MRIDNQTIMLGTAVVSVLYIIFLIMFRSDFAINSVSVRIARPSNFEELKATVQELTIRFTHSGGGSSSGVSTAHFHGYVTYKYTYNNVEHEQTIHLPSSDSEDIVRTANSLQQMFPDQIITIRNEPLSEGAEKMANFVTSKLLNSKKDVKTLVNIHKKELSVLPAPGQKNTVFDLRVLRSNHNISMPAAAIDGTVKRIYPEIAKLILICTIFASIALAFKIESFYKNIAVTLICSIPIIIAIFFLLHSSVLDRLWPNETVQHPTDDVAVWGAIVE
ncbi:hypothetical protein QA601_05995 [Chitinispirillales bacterium ANBcel5]|uniref:hypothetical protein n=1 Tax=Cellulosispirillum alkaliphilum TaxID=3039283 RepID=UPI002A507A00|nr:hypothetical protein [Chitinispirillales bacterium ANBcel5]